MLAWPHSPAIAALSKVLFTDMHWNDLQNYLVNDLRGLQPQQLLKYFGVLDGIVLQSKRYKPCMQATLRLTPRL